MSGPSAWQGCDRWGRRGDEPLGLQAGEVATFYRAPAIYAFLGGLAKLGAVIGFVMFIAILLRQHS